MTYETLDNFHVVSEGTVLSPARTLEEAIGAAKVCAQALQVTVLVEKNEGIFRGVIGRCTPDGHFEALVPDPGAPRRVPGVVARADN